MSPESNDNETSIQCSKDEQLLASLGYKQELKRDFHWLELLGFSFSVISVASAITWAAPGFLQDFIANIDLVSSVLVYSIPNGGAVAMVWGVRAEHSRIVGSRA